jgi:hypothetical protein
LSGKGKGKRELCHSLASYNKIPRTTGMHPSGNAPEEWGIPKNYGAIPSPYYTVLYPTVLVLVLVLD